MQTVSNLVHLEVLNSRAWFQDAKLTFFHLNLFFILEDKRCLVWYF